VRVPTIAEEDAKRPNRERECLVNYLFARGRPLWWYELVAGRRRPMSGRTSLREVLHPQIGRP
jgi:hypothetical protein